MATVTQSMEGYLVENLGGMKEAKPHDQKAIQEHLETLEDGLFEGTWNINDLDFNELVEQVMPEPMFKLFLNSKRLAGTGELRMMAEGMSDSIKASGFPQVWDWVITRAFRHFRRPDQMMPLERIKGILAEAGVLAEDTVVSPITASQMDRFRSRCETRVVADFSCPPAPTAFGNVFSRVNMPCAEYQDQKVCEFPLDPPPDLCCKQTNDDDPAMFYGLGPERCWKLPYPCFLSFAFAMHRNLVCVNANDFVRSQIEARVAWFDLIDEYRRIRLMFNAFPNNSCDSFPYNYDGIIYPQGWYEAADGAPWVNVVQDPNLAWTTCNEGPMCAIEEIFDSMRDPHNGFPVECGGPFQVVLTHNCTRLIVREVLGARLFTRSLVDGLCCGSAQSQRGPRERWSESMLYSPYAWDVLVDFYLNWWDPDGVLGTLASRIADPVLARRTAEHWVRNTYLVTKGLAQTWGTLVDYDVTTRTYEGTNTWMYFDRGIRWARRYDRKLTDGWLRPWLTLLVRAFDIQVDADGNAIP